MTTSPARVDPTDPCWFPFDLDLTAGRVRFLRLTPAVLERAVFLDHRIAVESRVPSDLPLDAIALPPPATPAWLFHTSFCCSSPLARAVHLALAVEVLKEPLALRRLSDAAHAGQPVTP